MDSNLDLERQQIYQQEYEKRLKQNEAYRQRQAETEQQATTPTPTPTPTTETKDPREYGFKENVGELKNAVVGGAVDLYNSVGSLPKLLDKRFYQPTDPKNPHYHTG